MTLDMSSANGLVKVVNCVYFWLYCGVKGRFMAP